MKSIIIHPVNIHVHDVIGDVERDRKKERKKDRHLRQWKNEIVHVHIK